MRTRLAALVSTLALAAALPACGGGGVKRPDFTAKADAICGPGNTAIAAVAKPANGAEVGTAAGTTTRTIDGQVAALRDLEAPGGKDAPLVERVIDAIAAVSGPSGALQEAAGRNDDAAMAKAATELRAKADGAAAQAQAYGLARCGTGLKPAVADLFEGTKSVVKTSYVAKAEGLCRDAVRRTSAVAAPGSSLASTSRYLDAVLAISEKLAVGLEALPAAPGDESTIGEFDTAFDTLNAKGREISAAAKANDSRLVIALSEELDVATTALNAKLDAYGLKTCASSG